MNKSFNSILSAMLIHILRTSLYISIMQYLRRLLYVSPLSVRRSIVKKSTAVPLWLCRVVLNFVTSPIGDERKWTHKIEQRTWKGVWIVPNLKNLKQAEDAALNNDLVVLYSHGGAYCLGHARMYMETFLLIINHLRDEHKIRASILSLEYSLSPENVWPKARDEAMDAYRYLIETLGIPASKIIFAGDSAGGNLTAAMLLTLKSQLNNEPEHLPLPAGAALFSPWIDLTINQPSFATIYTDIVCPVQVEEYVPYFIPNFNNLDEESRLSAIRNPLISPVYGDFSGSCPIFLAYGENELFRTSIEHFKCNLENAGCNLTTLIGENAMHVWIVNSLAATSKQVYERDCKAFINWMASIRNNIIENNFLN